MNKTRKRSKSLPIVLVPDHEQEPVALQMYGGELATPRPLPLRRSPRFFSTTTPIPIPQECSRRKSPRLANAEPPFTGLTCEKKTKTTKTNDNGEYSDGSKIVFDRRLLRSSPRFSGNAKVQEMALVKVKTPASSHRKLKHKRSAPYFIGDPIPDEEARERWGWRYEMKNQRSKGKDCASDDDDEDKIVSNVECHYAQARIGQCIFDLGDCAYIKGEGTQKHIGKILEFFKTTDGEEYFRVQWFYRAEDTVMKEAADFHDRKRLFYSTVMNDNPVDCIISKVIVAQVPPKIGLKSNTIPSSDFYFDMEYCVEYSTFRTLLTDNSSSKIHDLSLPSCIETVPTRAASTFCENMPNHGPHKAELALLDLYSGCGGMSTGLCLGAKLSCINLVTRWALDSDKSACESLKLNHPDAQVRNEAAEDFLELVKEWQKLCKRFAVNTVERENKQSSVCPRVTRNSANSASANRNSVDSPTVTGNGLDSPRVTRNSENSSKDVDILPGEYEVARIVDICYGDPNESGKRGLKFKVHWKGYSTSEDSWEPIEGLRNCPERIKEFVRNGFKSKILPLPGDVDVICGGPPCQGISGYNRFRNVDSPLDDERNRQIVIFMDIVEFLKPKYVLMENVVDILRFDKASLGRYALSRLVHMKYQARFGIIAAGCYGLPQFRLRVFIWGAHPSEKLPQFPLPTHDVIMKYWPPPEFERNTVAYDEDQPRELEKAVVLQDAISDLPAVTSHDSRDEMPYEKPPETEFQRFIRSGKSASGMSRSYRPFYFDGSIAAMKKYGTPRKQKLDVEVLFWGSTQNFAMYYTSVLSLHAVTEMTGSAFDGTARVKIMLYDHRPKPLSEDDYIRVCQIPKRKGANFRDLPGVVVGADNVARRTKEQMLLPSGKPMIPDYALTYEQGKSKRPFARLWWDETVTTVVTFPSLHSMAVLHPEQDRVLTIRECARLQGFPDYYRFCGTVKERYCQVGNAVPVVVARALGFALGMAFQKLSDDEPLMTLPPKFSLSTDLQLAKSLFQETD